MLKMKALYHSKTFTDDFEINFADTSKCKGVFKIEVWVHQLSVPLVLKDGLQQMITVNKPFIIESTHPITSGLLRFEFSDYPELQNITPNPFKKAIVRYLYCE